MKYLKLLMLNILCALLFYIDYMQNALAGGVLIIIILVVGALRSLVKKRSFKGAATHLYTCSIWMIAIFTSGIISNWLAASAVNEILEQAEIYKNETGKYPESLRELKLYELQVDERGSLRVLGSRLIILDGAILYKVFPGKWVRKKIDGTETKTINI